MTPGGLGPWFCALFFNTSTESKKQTHLIAHTLPHLACDMLNRPGTTSKDCWVIMLKIGPFDDWNVALGFLEQWMSRKRGKQRRLERGLELFALYRHAYNLVLWSQTRVDPLPAEQQQQQQQEEEEEDDEPAPPPPPEARIQKRDRTGGEERLLADVKRRFVPESALTIHGLVNICVNHFHLSTK